jgi:predicted methyltransferase
VPYATVHGSYTAAVNDPLKMSSERSKEYYAQQNQALRQKFTDNPAVYGKAKIVEFDPAQPVLGMDGSLDAVLTFRNVHNWRGNGQAEGMFKAFYNVLRQGGTLGVVEHRANADVPADDKSGYVSQAQVIALAEQAGFKLVAQSEINANPKDTKDYPGGVWTLPPVLREGDSNREKYLAIHRRKRPHDAEVRETLKPVGQWPGTGLHWPMLIAFNKPFGVLTQFTDRNQPPRRTLAEFGLPAGAYAAGRLDIDSEGLLLLSDDGARIAQISSPKFKWPKISGAGRGPGRRRQPPKRRVAEDLSAKATA